MKIIYISAYAALAGRQGNLTQVLYTCNSLTKKTNKLYLILFVPFWRIFKTNKILKGIDNKFKIKIIPIPFLKIKGIYFLFDLLSLLITIPFVFIDFKVYTRNQRFTRWIYCLKKEIYLEIHDLSKNTLDCLKKCKKAIFLSNTKTIIRDIEKLNIKRNLFYHPNAAELAENYDKDNFVNFKRPAVGYIGSNNPGKGVDSIIKIAKLNPTINFYLAGYIKIDNIPKNIYLLGLLNKHQIRQMLEKINLLIAPYKNKIFDNAGNDNSNYISPLKVFEYMASKKPFVISRLEFAQDILVEDKECLMAAPEDMNEWLYKIEKLLDNKNLSEKLSKNAYKKYSENFTWDIRAEKILKIIGNHT